MRAGRAMRKRQCDLAKTKRLRDVINSFMSFAGFRAGLWHGGRLTVKSLIVLSGTGFQWRDGVVVRGGFAAVLTGALVLLGGGAALAAEPAVPVPALASPAPEDWTITLDANLGFESDYPGAATRRFQAMPGIGFRRTGTKADFSSPDDGLDFSVFDIDWLKAGPVAKLMGSRTARGNRELVGLKSVGWTLEAGGFVEYWPMPNVRTRAELRQGINGHQGLVATLAGDVVFRPGAFTFAIGPRLNFANGQYMRKYFAVSPAEALANGRVTAFDAHAGASSIGGLASAAYEFSPAWTGTLWSGYQRLTGDAGRSPVPRLLGSRNAASFGASLSYSFDVKGFY